MIPALLLFLINLYIFINTKVPENLKIVREKYTILREHLKNTNNEEFEMLRKEIPITAHNRAQGGNVGYNVNKGSEIGLCINGEPNQIFHVLIHELAHCSVNEYSHSQKFWDKYDSLKSICVAIGVYQEIPQKTKFCGKYIQDK